MHTSTTNRAINLLFMGNAMSHTKVSPNDTDTEINQVKLQEEQ